MILVIIGNAVIFTNKLSGLRTLRRNAQHILVGRMSKYTLKSICPLLQIHKYYEQNNNMEGGS